MEAGGQVVGFTLVSQWPADKPNHFSISEFSILPAFRGRGFGESTLRRVVQAHPGFWRLRVYLTNGAGLAFWPKAIARAGGVDIVADPNEIRLIYTFRVSPERR